MIDQDFFSMAVTCHHAKRLVQFSPAATARTVLYWLVHHGLLSLLQADSQQIQRALERAQVLELIRSVALNFVGYHECSKFHDQCPFHFG